MTHRSPTFRSSSRTQENFLESFDQTMPIGGTRIILAVFLVLLVFLLLLVVQVAGVAVSAPRRRS